MYLFFFFPVRKENKKSVHGGVMNWAIGSDMYTVMCIKLMTNKNLLYKKYIYIIQVIQKKLHHLGVQYYIRDNSSHIIKYRW